MIDPSHIWHWSASSPGYWSGSQGVEGGEVISLAQQGVLGSCLGTKPASAVSEITSTVLSIQKRPVKHPLELLWPW